MRSIRCVAIDLDGTLLNSNKEISNENIRALGACLEQGIRIVIASGRFAFMQKHLISHTGLGLENMVHVAEGGGILFQGDKTITRIGEMTDTDYRTSLALLREFGYHPYASNGECVFRDTKSPLDVTYEMTRGVVGEDRFPSVKDLAELSGIMKLIFEIESPEETERLNALTGDGITVFRSAPTLGELTSRHLDKWFGIERLITDWGILPEQTAVIGDSGNDVRMVREAGLGLGMANALPEVVAEADALSTSDNDHDGVAELIYNYILKR